MQDATDTTAARLRDEPAQRPGRTEVGELFPDRDDVLFVIDQSRCIGCNACVAACAECGTHRGESMIHLDHVDRGSTVQTVPMVCMHCEDPTCAEVCPADAIKQTEDGVVQTSLKPRCIGCSNCVNACPFGVPKYMVEIDQMMKCDMCYDRTSDGLAPMCATVCPSEALWYGTRQEFEEARHGQLLSDWKFGTEHVSTKVATVVDDREPGPLDVLLGRDADFRWQDDPFGLEGHG